MEKVQLGENGPELSRLVSGVMSWGEWGKKLATKDILDLIHGLLQLGITTFDHADIYGNYTTEAAFGAALGKDAALRERMQLVTKCGIRMVTPNRPEHRLKSYNTSREYIIRSVERSLENLQTDRIDLLLLHRPDPLLVPEEVAEAFSRLRKSGKVLHFGVSNFLPAQFDLLNDHFPLCTNQVELSLLHSDPLTDGRMEHWMRRGIHPMAWSPLGGGELFSSGGKEQYGPLWEAFERLGDKYDAGADQLVLAWLLRLPAGILPVLGTTRLARLRAAVEALDIDLDRQDWFELWEAARGRKVP